MPFATDPAVAGLFQPFTLGPLELRNRIAMAPMTRCFSPGNIPGPDVAAYYKSRAEGGVGLIITEGTFINHPQANGYPNVPAFYGKALEGWKKVVDEVHSVNGKIAPQIWHTGPARRPGIEPDPSLPGIGPSEVVVDGKVVVAKATKQDIDDIVAAFGQAAADAKATGFDAVEIHGAHEYLIDAFLWEKTNTRDDEYGGSLENRGRLAIEVVKAVRAAVGPDFPVIFRFSQWKQQDYTAKLANNETDLARVLLPISKAGVDIFHASVRRFWAAEFETGPETLAQLTKRITGKPVITVGGIGIGTEFRGDSTQVATDPFRNPNNIVEVSRQLVEGNFDIAAAGRALLNDPQWPNKLQFGKRSEIRPFADEALKSLVSA
ncbi:MAG TPA: NADH:flavin oxidoreductase [Capsulimonadaceae bacterium]|jgi:2,4-dienoyl-CoA reductase-like NADH-dependent reductase (Old Yellow Enzyme family)